MSRSLLTAAVVALALVNPSAAVYTLDPADNISGANFFDFWYFNAVRKLIRYCVVPLLIILQNNDPTSGFVDYQTRANAQAKGLIG